MVARFRWKGSAFILYDQGYARAENRVLACAMYNESGHKGMEGVHKGIIYVPILQFGSQLYQLPAGIVAPPKSF
jgi:hypothetical protein